MFTLPAELLYVTRTALETQMAGCNSLARTALDSGASLIDVGVGLARDQIAAATAASNQLMFVRDPQDFVAIAAAQQHESLVRAQACGRRVAAVASEINTMFDGLSKDFAGTLSRTSIE